MSICKLQEGAKARFYSSLFDAHGCVYSIINAGEFNVMAPCGSWWQRNTNWYVTACNH